MNIHIIYSDNRKEWIASDRPINWAETVRQVINGMPVAQLEAGEDVWFDNVLAEMVERLNVTHVKGQAIDVGTLRDVLRAHAWDMHEPVPSDVIVDDHLPGPYYELFSPGRRIMLESDEPVNLSVIVWEAMQRMSLKGLKDPNWLRLVAEEVCRRHGLRMLSGAAVDVSDIREERLWDMKD